jgi:hypothetical protein
LKSRNVMVVCYKHLKKWNKGNQVNEKGLKNLTLGVTLEWKWEGLGLAGRVGDGRRGLW